MVTGKTIKVKEDTIAMDRSIVKDLLSALKSICWVSMVIFRGLKRDFRPFVNRFTWRGVGVFGIIVIAIIEWKIIHDSLTPLTVYPPNLNTLISIGNILGGGLLFICYIILRLLMSSFRSVFQEIYHIAGICSQLLYPALVMGVGTLILPTLMSRLTSVANPIVSVWFLLVYLTALCSWIVEGIVKTIHFIFFGFTGGTDPESPQ